MSSKQCSLVIYIASSFRNLHAVQMLRDTLKKRGHVVLDWSSYAPPLPDEMTPEERRAALDADEHGEIFNFCTMSCAQADLVIYLGQAGQDSACEVGIAFNAGVPVYGLAGVLEKPGTIMHRAVSQWFPDNKRLLTAVTKLARELRVED